MQKAKVLCFNLSTDELQCVQSAAQKFQAVANAIAPADFSQTVGALLGVFERKKLICLAPFSEKMMLMSGFDRERMEMFLDVLKTEGILIPYKAMTTPTNLFWNCDDLMEELKKEHEFFRSKKQPDA